MDTKEFLLLLAAMLKDEVNGEVQEESGTITVVFENGVKRKIVVE